MGTVGRISRAAAILLLVGRSPGVLDAQQVDDAVAAEEPSSIRIWNFVSGEVCRGEGDAEVGQTPSDRVCASQTVPIRGRDICIWAGEERRCTWFGFEFDYENADPHEPITCVWTRSRPVDEGNWEEVRNRGITTDTVQVKLQDVSGHHFEPGYNLFGAVPDPWVVVTMYYDCTYRGETVFAPHYRLIFSSAFQ